LKAVAVGVCVLWSQCPTQRYFELIEPSKIEMTHVSSVKRLFGQFAFPLVPPTFQLNLALSNFAQRGFLQ